MTPRFQNWWFYGGDFKWSIPAIYWSVYGSIQVTIFVPIIKKDFRCFTKVHFLILKCLLMILFFLSFHFPILENLKYFFIPSRYNEKYKKDHNWIKILFYVQHVVWCFWKKKCKKYLEPIWLHFQWKKSRTSKDAIWVEWTNVCLELG